ncbi:MAG: hypothetical protein LBN09_08530 [Clostridioides sp.]|nr:hypothetical protein [Clostridioides sp.]
MNVEEIAKAKEFISANKYELAYDLLMKSPMRSAEWFYLAGVAAMKLGKYGYGEHCLKKANTMQPGNSEYFNALNMLSAYTGNYRRRASKYNSKKLSDTDVRVNFNATPPCD